MKAQLACVLLLALAVSADKGGQGGLRGLFDFLGFDSSDSADRGPGRCVCSTGRMNPCRGVTGPLVRGCPNTNQYVQCTGAVCSALTCPTGQVWNKTQNVCAACATGMHVAASLQVCVCDQGTIFDPVKKACVPCPTGSTQDADTCYCPAGKAFDYKKNICTDCPTGSTLTRYQECKCTDATMFWNENAWACQACPGTWLPKQNKRPWKLLPNTKCTCAGTNAIFDRQSVQCYTCPAGTTASRDNAFCQCANRWQVFNMDTKACQCAKGLVADAAGTGCVRPAIPAAPAAGNP